MIEKYNELNKYENNFYKKKQYNIIGIDEVGRGPLAGPMVLAGVILDQNKPIYGIDDSKKISKKKRYELSEKIKKKAKAYYIFYVDVKQ